MCIAAASQERLEKERMLIAATVTNHDNLLIEALTSRHHWKMELLAAPKGALLKAYALLKRPLNFQVKAPTEQEAIAISLLQNRQDQAANNMRTEKQFKAMMQFMGRTCPTPDDDDTSMEIDHNERSLDALRSKNANHIKWKSLLTVPSNGKNNLAIYGLNDFLAQKACHENKLTAALAKERMFLVDMICKRALTRRATQTAELPRKVNYNILHLFKKLGRDLKNLVQEDPQDAAMFSMFYDSKLHTATEENLFFVATDPKILASNLSGADSAKLKKTFGFLNVATPAQQGGGAVRRNQYAPYSLPDAALPERPVRPNPTPAVSQVYFLFFFSFDTFQSVLLRFFDITCTIIQTTVFSVPVWY